MAVLVERASAQGLFVATYEGRVSHDEIVDAYMAFFDSGQWRAGDNELTDLRAADFRELDSDQVRSIASLLDAKLRELGVEHMKTAVLAPADLPFGIARMYEALSDTSPEAVQVFRDRDEALAWLATPAD